MSIRFRRNSLWLLFTQLRPVQWTKNTLVLAALIFTIPRVSVAMLEKTIAAFILFSLVSSCVYILNDFIDLEVDCNNPDKRHRPMASGRLDIRLALGCGFFLLLLSLILGFTLNAWFGVALIGYFMINVVYSLWLKNIVVIDIFTIAAGFVLRAAAGGFVISVRLTPWFLSCAMMLSLFLATGKRKYEYMIWHKGNAASRRVLEQYSPELLNQLSSVTAASVIMMYSMFTFSSGHSQYLMMTIPLVMYGIFRYFQLMHVENQGGRPEIVLVKDKYILGTVVLFTVMVITLLYCFG
ncbi:decaprenyl-phosphate phosphoribosyltransferase [Alicyclobacillus kakegawensis]|uniref:decaprenyl-phosphate phosphoribosyltransferase n=1 Tax=Alicyclobacillus kakegawensis TaxID=392012 RepID=UPI00083140EC|nr:decaprenyl-phosphate phosphoribosyltransferase [Alicyclobacillus kakegawensis]